MQLYKDVLASAWHQTIRRSDVWVFGLFAAFIFGTAGEIDRYLRFMNALSSQGHVVNPAFWEQQQWFAPVARFGAGLTAGNIQIWIFVVAAVATALCVLIMMSIAAGALITAAVQPKKKFIELFQAGVKHWVDLFFLFMSGYLMMVLTTFVLGVVVFSWPMPTERAQHWFVVCSSMALIPVVIVGSFLLRYAATSIVLEQKHLLMALRQAWQILHHHWLVTLEMAILNFVLVFLVNIGLLVAVGLLFAPQYGAVVAVAPGNALDEFSTALVTSGLAYIIVVVLAGAILATWQWIAWTLLFQRLRQDKPHSVLLHWLQHQAIGVRQ